MLQYGGRETRAGYVITYNDAKAQGAEGCQGDCTRRGSPCSRPRTRKRGASGRPVARPDGTKQWAFKGSPVYTFIGDKKLGDIEGNNRHVIVYGGPRDRSSTAIPAWTREVLRRAWANSIWSRRWGPSATTTMTIAAARASIRLQTRRELQRGNPAAPTKDSAAPRDSASMGARVPASIGTRQVCSIEPATEAGP